MFCYGALLWWPGYVVPLFSLRSFTYLMWLYGLPLSSLYYHELRSSQTLGLLLHSSLPRTHWPWGQWDIACHQQNTFQSPWTPESLKFLFVYSYKYNIPLSSLLWNCSMVFLCKIFFSMITLKNHTVLGWNLFFFWHTSKNSLKVQSIKSDSDISLH